MGDEEFGQRLGASVLDWLNVSGKLMEATDLCLIESVPGINVGAIGEIDLAGKWLWAIARVDGDLALRCAIVESNGLPLLAFCDVREDAFQADLRERAVLRRVIRPLASHLLTAATGQDASSIDDARFRSAVLDVLERGPALLQKAALRRTWNGGMRDHDAAALLCDAAFGFNDRQSSMSAGDLWARWLRDPPVATESLLRLASEVLRHRYPGQAAVLNNILRTGPRKFLVNVALDPMNDHDADQLAIDTARQLQRTDASFLADVLSPAESAFVSMGAPIGGSQLLEQAFLTRRHSLIRQCETDQPPAHDELDNIQKYLYAPPDEARHLTQLARLARGLWELETLDPPASLNAYRTAWLDELAWLDRAARRVRTANVADSVYLKSADLLVRRWYSLRDRWNAAFAAVLVGQFSTLFAAPGEAGPYVVSHVLKYIVAPELANKRTFLMILDGCDLPTFLELLDAFATAGVAAVSPLDLVLSAIPTMTSHARRAIFGGDIPGDGLRADDDRAADAAGDRKAFENPNNILKKLPRRLFLKGDLADSGVALVSALKTRGAEQLIAAVFNDVDDSLSSKERTPLAERTLGNTSRALREAIAAAADEDWRIVVTADHGNTPYREPDSIVTGLGGARFAELTPGAPPPLGTVVFERGVGLPYRIAALHQLGAHGGPQHVGYHGGVSIEEMFVPLAVLGHAQADVEIVRPPQWWSDSKPTNHIRHPVRAKSQPITESHSMLARCRAVLQGDGNDPKNVEILEAIAAAGVLTSEQLASKVALKGGRIRLRVTGIVGKLRAAGLAVPIVIEDEPEAFRWVGSA